MEIKQIKTMGKTLVSGMMLCISLLVTGCSELFSRITLHANSEPIITVAWIDSAYVEAPIKCFWGEKEHVIDCSVDYSIKKGRCFFNVTSPDDTIVFSISEYYVGTNVDSINIVICWASEKSSMSIIPDCSWTFHGRFFTQGGRPMNEFCDISSTKPVHVAAFIIVDWKKDNKKRTIYEYKNEVEMMQFDSIIHAIP